mmetsp:Transcript_110874/g.320453  ORF Transcript_110874/g.320453 Transcript_110874/m.320453 type:complete len:262 (+) Transcript_110874:605-1390(+)
MERAGRSVRRRREAMRRQEKRCRQTCARLEGEDVGNLHSEGDVLQCLEVLVGVHSSNRRHTDLGESVEHALDAIAAASRLEVGEEVHVDAQGRDDDVHPRERRDGRAERDAPQQGHDDDRCLADDEVAARSQLRLRQEGKHRRKSEQPPYDGEPAHLRNIEATPQHRHAPGEVGPRPVHEHRADGLHKQGKALVVGVDNSLVADSSFAGDAILEVTTRAMLVLGRIPPEATSAPRLAMLRVPHVRFSAMLLLLPAQHEALS